MKIILS